jgi:hypothetical protein
MPNTIRTHPDHPDHARRAHARARIHLHELRELQSLERAVRAADDTVARLLEARADQAHLDAHAIAAEHDLNPIHDHN